MQVKVSRFDSLEDAQAVARRAVDERAEEVRVLFITPGSGQALEYQSVIEEARAFEAGQPGPYFMLQADVDAGMAQDLSEAADLVLQTRANWEMVGASIRSIRLGFKEQVKNALTIPEVNAIRDQAFMAFDALVTESQT